MDDSRHGKRVLSGAAGAELFNELTIGVPVKSIDEAEAWYINIGEAIAISDVVGLTDAQGIFETS